MRGVFPTGSRIRAVEQPDGVRLILPRKPIPISGPLKTLLLGLAMLIVPIGAGVAMHKAGGQLDDYHTIVLIGGFPIEVIGVLLILAATFGLMPTHCEVRLTPDWFIFDRWNGPFRFRKRWPLRNLTGIQIVGDDSTGGAVLQLQATVENVPDVGFGYSLALLSELADELTRRCGFVDPPVHVPEEKPEEG